MISAQAFFFSTSANDSLKDDRELVGIRMKLQQKIAEVKANDKLVATPAKVSGTVKYEINSFATALYSEDININTFNYSVEPLPKGEFYVNTYNLYYNFQAPTPADTSNLPNFRNDMHKKIFPPMEQGHYLIRAFTKIDDKTTLMYQVLVYKNTTGNVITKSFEEIWF